MNKLTITIYPSSEDGVFEYAIYDVEPEDCNDENEPMHTGQCTGSLSQAIQSASDDAQTLIETINKI